jgi:hypothetical protein
MIACTAKHFLYTLHTHSKAQSIYISHEYPNWIPLHQETGHKAGTPP